MSNIAAIPVLNKKGEITMQPTKVQRYRPGKAPVGADITSDTSDEEEDERRDLQQLQNEKRRNVQQKHGLETEQIITEISSVDIASDRRLRRLQQISSEDHGVRRRRHYEEDIKERKEQEIKRETEQEIAEEEELDEQENAKRRELLRKRAIERAAQEEEALGKDQDEEEEEDEYTSEEDSSDSEDDILPSRTLFKPVFIPKQHRETILEKERLQKEEEEAEARRQKQLEERKLDSHNLVAETIKKELAGEEQGVLTQTVDDTDGLDEEAEYELWKLRELKRIKRDREEAEQRERERAEMERLRNLTEEERRAEDLKRQKEAEAKRKSKSKIKFLQKYYHKGAFYQDSTEEVLQRDYSAPTLEDHFDKSILPEVMQVKNFGKASQTKWTHLSKEDTSRKDDLRFQDKNLVRRTMQKMAGMKSNNGGGGFEKPSYKKK